MQIFQESTVSVYLGPGTIMISILSILSSARIFITVMACVVQRQTDIVFALTRRCTSLGSLWTAQGGMSFSLHRVTICSVSREHNGGAVGENVCELSASANDVICAPTNESVQLKVEHSFQTHS